MEIILRFSFQTIHNFTGKQKISRQYTIKTLQNADKYIEQENIDRQTSSKDDMKLKSENRELLRGLQ